MGAVHSDLKANIVQACGTAIRQDDSEFWPMFWRRPETAEHVFESISPTDIRRMRDDPSSFQNLETLIFLTAERILLFRSSVPPGFVTSTPIVDEATKKEVMNCIRILTRLLPYVYESDNLRDWEESFFWTERDFNTKFKIGGSRVENILDKMEAYAADNRHGPATSAVHKNGRPLYVRTQRCLGVQLINALIDLLFHDDLTIPSENFGGEPHTVVSYQIWQSGIARKAVVSSREFENRRTEILQLLLTMQSKSIYMTRDEYLQRPVQAVECVSFNGDNMRVLTLLVSMLNTIMKYHPNTWIPLDPRNSDASKEIHIRTCLHFLLVNLLHRAPCSNDSGTPQTNCWRKNFSKLHDAKDFQFLTDGILKILRQPSEVASNVLAKSQKPVTWAHEMLPLLWEALADNKRYRTYVIDTNRALDLMILLIYYATESKTEGVVRVSVFCLLALSQEPGFGASLNRPFDSHDSLPAAIQIKNFHGTYADYLIMSLLSLVGEGPADASIMGSSLLAVVNNISPHVTQLGRATSMKLVHVFAWMSAPAFLLASGSNVVLLGSVLRSINSLVESHETGHENENVLYAVWRSQDRFEALNEFCTADEEELEEQQRRLRKFGSNEMMRPQYATASSAASRESEDGEPTADESLHATSNSASQQPLSEKAQGKQPENFREPWTDPKTGTQYSVSLMTGVNEPSASSPELIRAWLPNLPRHTTLMLISNLNKYASTLDTPRPTPQLLLAPIREAGTTGIPRSQPSLSVFHWQPSIVALYASFYWGLVVSQDIARGAETGQGIWAGTEIRLFGIRRGQVQAPSLWSPKGAVDAVGENLVSAVRNAAGKMVG